MEVLQDMIKNGLKETLPGEFFEAIKGTTIRADDTFLMNGLDGFSPDPTCTDVLRYYATIYTEWNQRQDIVPREIVTCRRRWHAGTRRFLDFPDR